MKNLLSVLLAVAMIATMSAVSFAATKTNDGVCHLVNVPFAYDEDGNYLYASNFEYGKPVYFVLLRQTNGLDALNDDHHALVTDQDMVDGMKVKLKDYEEGESLVESFSIVKTKITSWFSYWHYTEDVQRLEEAMDHSFLADDIQNYNEDETLYVYLLKIETKAKETTTDDDIIATVELNKSKSGDDKLADGTKLDYKVKDLETDIAVNIGYEMSYNGVVEQMGSHKFSTRGGDTPYYVKSDSAPDGTMLIETALATFDPDTYYLLKYNYDDETEFTFGSESDQNEGTFTVDVSGQGKNLLYFNTIPDEAIAAANPDAKIFALNFNDTKFNRTGEFLYEADDLEYAYQLMGDGSLKLLGEFENGEVTFKTRILSKYLFSDIELVAPAKAPTTVATVVEENPGTGGN